MRDWWTQRRLARLRRRVDGRALRAEFELEQPRGLAALRAFSRQIGELERARMTARVRALDELRASRRPPAPEHATSRR